MKNPNGESRKRVIFISGGLTKPKKADSNIARRHQYLNYGALSLCTMMSREGYKVLMFHGGYENPSEFLARIDSDVGLNKRDDHIMISIPSFLSLGWCRRIIHEIREIHNGVRITVGGRWVVDENDAWVRGRLGGATDIVGGTAEPLILQLASGVPVDRIPEGIRMRQGTLSAGLNFRLIDRYLDYQPCIEVSRGCGMGCSFCQEGKTPITPLKDPCSVVADMRELLDQYEGEAVSPYFQASCFRPTPEWSERLADEIEREGLGLQWRCESRVDAISPEMIGTLSDAGMKIIDLGLESASKEQIVRMRKAGRPDNYLESAARLLDACRKNDVWVKLNILMYAGETYESIQMTQEWLDSNRSSFMGVSVGSLMAFGSPDRVSPFVASMSKYGTSINEQKSDAGNGVYRLNLSREISCEEADELALGISRKYMRKRDYFRLKKFSYFPRWYSYDDFGRDLLGSKGSTLPFS